MENNENTNKVVSNTAEVKAEIVVEENNVKTENKNQEKTGVNPFSIASVVFAAIGMFALGFAFGLAAMVAGIKGLMDKEKNPVFKIVALIGLVI